MAIGLLTEYAGRLERLNYSPHTRKAYLRAARRFCAAYPDLRLEATTPEHIERHLYGQGWSPRTVTTQLENLRPFFTWLWTQKRLVRTNPCQGVERPRWKPRLRPAPTYADFEALRSCCRTLEEAALVETLYFTGLRYSEFRAVQIRDVDLAHRRITVLGKGDRERVVVFPARVGTLLRLLTWRQGNVHPDARLFWGRKGKRIETKRSEQWIRRTLWRLGCEAGLPYRLSPHILRHGWFRLMKTRGVSVEVAMRLGGHTNIQTTAHIYGQMDIEDLQAAYDRYVGLDGTVGMDVPGSVRPR